MSPLAHPIRLPADRVAGRVSIRALRSRDAGVLRQLLNENRGWLQPWEATVPGGGVPPGAQPTGPSIRELHRQRRHGSSVTFAVCYQGELVGQLSVADITGGAVCSAAIGYWVAQRVAGRGITPVAVALAIDYAFTQLQLHRIEICVRPENRASLRVVQKLGMRYEGRRERYIHIAGRWCDHEIFAVTADEVLGGGMIARIGAPGGGTPSKIVQ